ncbi:hypothetical protein PPL_07545 [Heterostelium album PN500]|uniref:tRNA pseudouridine(55) synthase n=1 Tax=Heterostelium pallidum (strain ATCC 26659 / Pp 5 / PN500) TaxID=670386 RepID=D3BG94_HETP5|nr:hypothetical protein PPL_07545 [Heterostelium album PN500]EFA79494.1 hypothetical protein PPL_07545 [Heterostelium album PN500]|eukprot:XP_020431615.1 hypothetical protein PPL_07545 [Heterostelium album PN500]
MLQNTNDSEFLDKLLENVSKCGYEFVDYSLQLWVPYSTIIREFSVWYHLKQHHDDTSKTQIFKHESPEDNVVEIKEAVKWSDFRMNMNYGHEESKDEHLFLFDIKLPDRKKLKQQKKNKRSAADSSYQIMDVLDKLTMKDFIMNGTCPPSRPTTKFDYTLSFEHAPIFIAGRYNKYARNLSQTPWTLKGAAATPDSEIDSVDLFISQPIKDLCKADATNFVASGREDIDVRMLGEGRPFFLEITNPHRIFMKYNDFREIENKINENQDIRVSRLQVITKKQTSILKDGETSKQKIYRCTVWTAKEFNIWASAGTYIKEFVHGDLGRTTPNLGSLLNTEADILQLDVLDIDLDFPPIPTNK